NDGYASRQRGLVLLPPDELAARYEGTIDGTLQRFPAICGIDTVKICNERAAEKVVPTGVRAAHVEIAVVGQILIEPKMPNYAHVILHLCSKNIGRVAAVDLSGKVHKPVLGRGKDVLNRDAGIVNAVLTAHQVLRHQRTVHPRQHMVVHGVDLAESG